MTFKPGKEMEERVRQLSDVPDEEVVVSIPINAGLGDGELDGEAAEAPRVAGQEDRASHRDRQNWQLPTQVCFPIDRYIH